MTVGDAHPQSGPAARGSALVLGGGGFIGGHLLRVLASRPEYGTIETAGRGMGAAGDRIRTLEGSVDPQLLERCTNPDVVFWAIGGASVGASVRDPARDFATSIPPLSALLDRMDGPWQRAHLVFLSSAAVYGSAASRATATSCDLRPISPYGMHKKLSEEMIADRSRLRGWKHTIVRPFSVYGPGLRRQLFWDALAKAACGDFLFDGGGGELRDWVYVDDLVSLVADIGASTRLFPTLLNAGTGRGITVASALRQLFAFLPSTPEPRFRGGARGGDPEVLVADPREQQLLSGYFRTGLREGLEHYVRWHRALPA